MATFTQRILCIFLFLALCLAPAGAGAEEELIWPLTVDLVLNPDDAVETQEKLGEVKVWNTKDDLKIRVTPTTGRTIRKVAIHIVDDQELLEEQLLDNKGQRAVLVPT